MGRISRTFFPGAERRSGVFSRKQNSPKISKSSRIIILWKLRKFARYHRLKVIYCLEKCRVFLFHSHLSEFRHTSVFSLFRREKPRFIANKMRPEIARLSPLSLSAPLTYAKFANAITRTHGAKFIPLPPLPPPLLPIHRAQTMSKTQLIDDEKFTYKYPLSR